MSEKKIITIRFHLNRQRDRCAWENLEKLKSISRKSYNDILVEMLAEQRWGLEQSDIEDLAWRLCSLINSNRYSSVITNWLFPFLAVSFVAEICSPSELVI